MKKLSRLFHTVRHLKCRQIVYRVIYKLHKPRLKPVKCLRLRDWDANWNAPRVLPSPISDSGEITFLHETGYLDEDCLWNNLRRSKLWLYNLHYFDVLNAKESLKESHSHIELMQSLIQKWIDENPPSQGNGWEPYPLSLRIINWVKWFSRYPERVQSSWFESLALQVAALNQRIEYHICGNHLFANAKALVFAGAYFDGSLANRWILKGLKILKNEISEQFLSDGGHFELTPMYHATMLWDMCDLVNLAVKSNHAMLLSQKNHWMEVIERGLAWLNGMVHPDGEIAFFNDAAFDIAPTQADLLLYERQLWIDSFEKNSVSDQILRGNSISRRQRSSLSGDFDNIQHNGCESLRYLKDSGYCVVNLQNNGKAILDVANVGPEYQPGHAHADTLSFELSLYGQRFLVNSGTSLYGEGPMRQYQRSTIAHNTVCIHGENSSEVWGGFRVAQRAYPHDLSISSTSKQILIRCSHSGYKRLPSRNTHSREWVFVQNSVMISDVISGGDSEAEARFYFHPSVQIIKQEEHTILCLMLDEKEIWMTVDGARCLEIETSHWYPSFGVTVKNTCLIAKLKKNKLKTQITW